MKEREFSEFVLPKELKTLELSPPINPFTGKVIILLKWYEKNGITENEQL